MALAREEVCGGYAGNEIQTEHNYIPLDLGELARHLEPTPGFEPGTC